jgi:Uncharacterized conserved protein
LYNGEYKWSAEKNFKNIINHSELFGNNVVDFEYVLIDINKFEKEELMELGNITSAIFLLDQKVDIHEFVSRLRDIALYFKNLTEEEKMILKHWLRNTLSDDLKNTMGKKLEEVLSVNKEEVLKMTSNISKTIKETFEKAKKEGKEEGAEVGRIVGIMEGKLEGKEEERRDLILKQYSKGLSVDYIADINDLDIEYVKKVVEKAQVQEK